MSLFDDYYKKVTESKSEGLFDKYYNAVKKGEANTSPSAVMPSIGDLLPEPQKSQTTVSSAAVPKFSDYMPGAVLEPTKQVQTAAQPTVPLQSVQTPKTTARQQYTGMTLKNDLPDPTLKNGRYYAPENYYADADAKDAELKRLEKQLKSVGGAYDKTVKETEKAAKTVTDIDARLKQLNEMYAIQPSDKIYSEFMRLSGERDTAYGEYQAKYNEQQAAYETYYLPYYNAYEKKRTEFNDYLSSENDRYAAWKGTIRNAAAVQAELDKVNRKIAENRKLMEIGGGKGTAAGAETQDLLKLRNLLAEELDYSRYYSFDDLRENPDFAEKSKYAPTNAEYQFEPITGRWLRSGGDTTYEYINRNPEAVNAQTANDINSGGALAGFDSSYLGEMTDDEIAMYNYLYATDKARADEYLEYINKNLTARQMEKYRTKVAADARENGLVSSIGSTVLGVLTKPVSYLNQAADYLLTGEIDENASYNMPVTYTQTVRDTVGAKIENKWGKVGSFAYQTGMSMADFLFTTAITGGFLGLGGTAAKLSEAASLAIMGMGAAADGTVEAKRRGLSDGQAFALGTIAGAAEILTEKFSVEALLEDVGKRAGTYILKNTFTEGAEEVGSDIINLIADVMIAGDKSEWQESIDEYMRQGKSKKEAFALTLGNKALEMGLDFAGGALSGGIMSAGGVAINSIANRSGRKDTGSAVRKMGDEAVDSLISEGLSQESGKYKDYAETLEKRIQDGKEITDKQIGKLYEYAFTVTPVSRVPAIGEAQPLPTLDEQARQKESEKYTNVTEKTGVLYGVEKSTIDRVRRISDKLSKPIVFMDADAAYGLMINGKHENGTIYVNTKSANPVAQIIGHELTHSLENTEAYRQLSDYVLSMLTDEQRNELRLRHKKFNSAYQNYIDDAAADAEIVAEFAEKNLLTNEQAINNLVSGHRSVGEMLSSAVDKIAGKLGNTDAQARNMLRTAKKLYAAALRQSQTTQAKTQAAAQVMTEQVGNANEQYDRGNMTDAEWDAEWDSAYDADAALYGAGLTEYSLSEAEKHSRAAELREMLKNGATGADLKRYLGTETNTDTNTKISKNTTDGAQRIIDAARREGVSVSEYLSENAEMYEVDGEYTADARRALDRERGTRYSISPAQNAEYMRLAKNPEANRAELERMVEKAAKAAGYYAEMFHETNADNIHIFDIQRGDHGGTDSETPYGIFTKSSDKNIGLGNKQMKLYVRANKTLVVNDRAEVKNRIPALVPVYDKIAEIDQKYHSLVAEATVREIEALDQWIEEHPEADLDVIMPVEKIARHEAYDIDSDEYLRAHNEYVRLMDEWKTVYAEEAIKAKEIITNYLIDHGYDSMYFVIDEGSGGRQTDSLILLRENQVKSADPVTYDDNGNVIPLSERFKPENKDIRYSISEAAATEDDARFETLSNATRTRLNNVRKALGQKIKTAYLLSNHDLFRYVYPEINQAMAEFIKDGYISDKTRRRITDSAYDAILIREDNEDYADLRERMKTLPVALAEQDRADVGDWKQFKKDARGLLKLAESRDASGAVPVDSAYAEYSAQYPGLFPSDVTNPADQLVLMLAVAEEIQPHELTPEEKYGEEAATELKRTLSENMQVSLDEFVGGLENAKESGIFTRSNPTTSQKQFVSYMAKVFGEGDEVTGILRRAAQDIEAGRFDYRNGEQFGKLYAELKSTAGEAVSGYTDNQLREKLARQIAVYEEKAGIERFFREYSARSAAEQEKRENEKYAKRREREMAARAQIRQTYDNALAKEKEKDAKLRADLNEKYAKQVTASGKTVESAVKIDRDMLKGQALSVLERSENELVSAVRTTFGIPYSEREAIKPYIQSLTEEYLANGKISESSWERAYNDMINEAHKITSQYSNKNIAALMWLNGIRITPTNDELASMTNKDGVNYSGDLLKKTRRSLDIAESGGMSIADAYLEASAKFPGLFDGEKTNAAAMLRSLAYTANDIRRASGFDVAKIDENKQANITKFIERFNEQIDDLRQVKRYADQQVAKQNQPQPDHIMTKEQRIEASSKMRNARRALDKAERNNLMTDMDRAEVGRLLRGEITPELINPILNVRGIREIYEARKEFDNYARQIKEWNAAIKARDYETADQYLGNILNDFDDKKVGLLYSRETMERNIRDITKNKELADKIIAEYFTPVHKNEAAKTDFTNQMLDRVRKLGIDNKVRKGNTVSEAFLVQFIGEAESNIKTIRQRRLEGYAGATAEEWQSRIDEAKLENPNINYDKVYKAIGEFQRIYDEFYNLLNNILVENGYEPIGYITGYFPHMMIEDDNGSGLRRFAEKLGIDLAVDELPTTINGLTQTFKPGKSWFGSLLERTGNTTDYDAIEGFRRYLNGAADVLYHTRDIKKIRAFAERIRYNASSEAIKAKVDEINANIDLSEDEKQARREAIYKDAPTALSNFVVELDEYANILANKKSKYDRWIEGMLGRRMYTIMKNVKQRVGANMVAANLSSAVTNVIPMVQAAARGDPRTTLKAMWQVISNENKNDHIRGKSAFLTNRRGVDPFYETGLEKASRIAGFAMNAIDNFSSEVVWRSRYNYDIAHGMSEQNAIDDADAFSAGVMADRSKGAMPTLFAATNPLVGAFTQFQLEVNNQYSELFKDVPRQFEGLGKRERVLRVALTMFRYAIYAYLFDDLYEAIFGRRSALDPLSILNNAVGDFTGYQLNNLVDATIGGEGLIEKRNKSKNPIADIAQDVVEELPFASAAGSLLSGVFGTSFDGGRIPLSSALPNAGETVKAGFQLISDAVNGELTKESARKQVRTLGEELSKPLTYMVMPFGGSQLRKTAQGIEALINGGSYKLDSNGNPQLQYPIYTDEPLGVIDGIKSVVFGKSSTTGAREWVQNGFGALSATDTGAYTALVAEGVGQRDAYEWIKGYNGLEPIGDAKSASTAQKLEYIASSELTASAKEEMYFTYLVGSDTAYERAMTDLRVLSGVGMDAGDYLDLLVAKNQITAKYSDEDTSIRSVEVSRWINQQGYHDKQAAAVKSVIGYSGENHYDKFISAGVADSAAYSLAKKIYALEPLPGASQVSSVQKYRAIVDQKGLTREQQVLALKPFMNESDYTKMTAVNEINVLPEVFVRYKEAIAGQSVTQDNIKYILDTQFAQYAPKIKAALWQISNKSWKAYSNPYSTDIGTQISNALMQER